MPLPEYDAKVFGRPGEYHLGHGQFLQPSTRIVVSCIHRAFVPSHVHITVAHMTVIHIHVVHVKETRNSSSILW
jgi:hypothetical protein